MTSSSDDLDMDNWEYTSSDDDSDMDDREYTSSDDDLYMNAMEYTLHLNEVLYKYVFSHFDYSFEMFCTKFKKRKPTALSFQNYFKLENVIFRNFMKKYGQEICNHLPNDSIQTFKNIIKLQSKGIMKPINECNGYIIYDVCHLKNSMCDFATDYLIRCSNVIINHDLIIFNCEYNGNIDRSLVLMIGDKDKLETIQRQNIAYCECLKCEYEFVYLNEYTLLTEFHGTTYDGKYGLKFFCRNNTYVYHNNKPPVLFKKMS